MSDKTNRMQSEPLRKKLLLNKLRLLRKGELSTEEIRKLAADVGTANLAEAIPDLEHLLDYPDDIVRYNSISSLAYEFGVCGRLQRLQEILLTDPDELNRGQAAAAIGSLNRASKDARSLALLARLAHDETASEHVRISAYTAIFNVLGVPYPEQPKDIESPADFDWKLIEKYKV